MNKKLITLLILLTTLSLSLFSQMRKIEAKISQLRNETTTINYSQYNNTCSQKPQEIFKLYEKYNTDTVPSIRSFVYTLTHKSTIKQTDKHFRTEGVLKLTNASLDKNSGNCSKVTRYLQNYNREDFSPDAIEVLKELLKEGIFYKEEIVKLCAFINNESLNVELLKLKNTPEFSNGKKKWALTVALSRIGHKPAVEDCLAAAIKTGNGDALTYNLIDDLIFSRSKLVFDYLIELLNSNDKVCSSPNPDSESKILCGYQIMEYLAPRIKDFPLKTGISGQIKTNNYEEALLISRKWFAEHQNNYKILNDTY